MIRQAFIATFLALLPQSASKRSALQLLVGVPTSHSDGVGNTGSVEFLAFYRVGQTQFGSF
jgi:hypothetical protein